MNRGIRAGAAQVDQMAKVTDEMALTFQMAQSGVGGIRSQSPACGRGVQISQQDTAVSSAKTPRGGMCDLFRIVGCAGLPG